MKNRSFLMVLVSTVALFAAAIALAVPFNPDPVMTRSVYVQPDETYPELWSKVQKMEDKGLPKSAREVVDLIYEKAKADSNAPQLCKAVIHQMKYISQIEEEALVKVITKLQTEVAEADYPVKPLLQSLLAELYWNYYRQNLYRFQNRTETVQFKNDDISTWDLRKIVTESLDLFLASLSDKSLLQATNLDVYDEILHRQGETRSLRGSLYDFLAHRAIDFLSNEEAALTRPSYQFKIDQEGVFARPEDFVKVEFDGRDSLSQHLQVMRIMQDLMAFHLKSDNADALLDLDLKRLKFAHEHSVLGHKDSLYVKALRDLEKQYAQTKMSAWVNYALGLHFEQKGAGYASSKDPQLKSYRKKAMEVCQRAITRFPKGKSKGLHNCKALADQLQYKELSMITEKIAPPQKASRALVKYRNLDKVWLRIVPVDYKQLESLNSMMQDERQKMLSALSADHSWTVDLPKDEDFNPHSAEISLPKLDLGLYLLLASPQEDFASSPAMNYNILRISQLAFSSRRIRGAEEFFVTDRESGEPLQGVNATVWSQDYDYKLRKYVKKKHGNFTTDAFGSFTVRPQGRNGSHTITVRFEKGNDILDTDDSWYLSRPYSSPEVWQTKVIFFTDRAIYRPGQTVYFKGIALESKGGENRIKTRHTTFVHLRDANYQDIAKVQVVSNEYGTFSGTFTIPLGGLNGTFSIRDHNGYGQQSFRVEDYKRPKFEVTFDPVKGSFRLDEEVSVTGQAKAYAGSNIDGAKVQYRVVRGVRFPYWRGWYWGYPSIQETEISNGVAETDEEGKFEVKFIAKPDLSVSKERQPEFYYRVIADVTDITGETHSSEQSVQVGYVALSISVGIPENVNADQKSAFPIHSKNLNGQDEDSKGQIRIWKLKEPDRIFRQRLWEQPDKFVMDKAEFYKLFPHDVYDRENDHRTWEQGKQVYDKAFNTQQEDTLRLTSLKKWEQGWYVLKLTTQDAFGEKIETESYFKVQQPADKEISSKESFLFLPEKLKGEPGEQARFTLGTAEDQIQVLYILEHKGEEVSREWIRLPKGKKEVSIDLEEKHRGGLGFYLLCVRNGRVHYSSQSVVVPWSNKELTIEYETFRDKLLPGQKEQWKVKISGPKGEAVSAEMLVGMYDASLDAIVGHDWNMFLNPSYYNRYWWSGNQAFATGRSNFIQERWNVPTSFQFLDYEAINWFGFSPHSYLYGSYRYAMTGAVSRSANMDMAMDEMAEGDISVTEAAPEEEKAPGAKPPSPQIEESTGGKKLEGQDKELDNRSSGGEDGQLGDVQIRTNLNETAFFYPDLQTNDKGEVIISFTVPEALTRWRILGLAHTKDLKVGKVDKSLVTQKDLMVMPNSPRFFREGDKIYYAAKVSNLSEKDLNGTAELEILDALTYKNVDAAFGNGKNQQSFSVKAGRSAALVWEIKVPEGIQAVAVRTKAKAGNFTDGEENVLPVLTNRMLVTESMPLPVRPGETRAFTFTKMKENQSKTLRHHKYTLEFTSNPAWYAVQALPYMMEYPYECAEQVFSRYYANSLGAHVANSHPRIKAVFDAWKNRDKEALLSNLEKNQELKYLLLEETPWVVNAQNESQRKQRVGLLFDLNHMGNQLASARNKLVKMQVSNGGFPWFKGGPDSRYITQHIVTGFGHLDRLGVDAFGNDNRILSMLKNAVSYLDERIREDYQRLLDRKVKMEDDHLSYVAVHYLYARSFFKDQGMNKAQQKAFDYFMGQAKKYWLQRGHYLQGMIALALHRYDDKEIPDQIMASIKEHAITDQEMGMYWKQESGWYWYQAPIETQALLIEAFDEITEDLSAVEEMKLWLLKQKQTQDWKTTKATAEACYVLLLRGTDLLAQSEMAEITVGGEKIDPQNMPDIKVEAGTGYFKTSWSGSEIRPKMAEVEVKNPNSVAAWGAVYWQYFEDLDKITPHETPLSLKKQLFLQENSDYGPKLKPISPETQLEPGDLIKVRIELRVDRAMEYVHMKDMRASGFEPVNVLSSYKWQDGLGYYESTRDAATNFFFSWLPKGTYVFEYPLRVNHRGDFSNGITTIQCMYAPEFTSHSEGIRVKVE